MTDRTHLTAAEVVHDERSWLFTVRDQYGEEEEVILVPCEDGTGGEETAGGAADSPGVEAWLNRCTHESQRLDAGRGAAMRDGEIICPKHGSMFDACSGHCDNGKAANTTLVSVGVAVEDGEVYLTDDTYEFDHEGSIADGDDDDDDMPSSTSHIGF